jgi:hypothetical protein
MHSTSIRQNYLILPVGCLKSTNERKDILTINTQGLNQGVYLLNLSTSGGKNIAQKIIIQ